MAIKGIYEPPQVDRNPPVNNARSEDGAAGCGGREKKEKVEEEKGGGSKTSKDEQFPKLSLMSL